MQKPNTLGMPQDKPTTLKSTMKKWTDKLPTSQTLYFRLLGIVGFFFMPFVLMHVDNLKTTFPTNGHFLWVILAALGGLLSISATYDICRKIQNGLNSILFKVTDNKTGAKYISYIPEFSYYGYLGYLLLGNYID